MSRYDTFLDWASERIRSQVMCAPDPSKTPTHSDVAQLARTLRPGDVLLIDGCDRVSAAIRYFTQSSWSHAALYVGGADRSQPAKWENCLVEVNLGEGCVLAPLDKYAHYPTRICRPSGLDEAGRRSVVQFMIDHIGTRYDTRNVIDLARYMLPGIPMPRRFRRRALSLGSGEPTRAICSTLIAQAFQSVRYPILPIVERAGETAGRDGYSASEILHIRHHSLFAPRDFDLSPYFDIVKPRIEDGVDSRTITWSTGSEASRAVS